MGRIGGFLLATTLAGPAPLAAQDASRLAEACNVCHGPRGAGMGSIPPLAGRDATDLTAAMTAFRANERPATIMNRIARGYSGPEIAALAAHYAGQR